MILIPSVGQTFLRCQDDRPAVVVVVVDCVTDWLYFGFYLLDSLDRVRLRDAVADEEATQWRE